MNELNILKKILTQVNIQIGMMSRQSSFNWTCFKVNAVDVSMCIAQFESKYF